MKDLDPEADFVEQVHASLTRLTGSEGAAAVEQVDTAAVAPSPMSGVEDVQLADDTGLELPTVRAALLALADEHRVEVDVPPEDQPWLVTSVVR